MTRNKIAINLKSNRHHQYGENLSHRPTVSSCEVVLAKVHASLGHSNEHSASHDDWFPKQMTLMNVFILMSESWDSQNIELSSSNQTYSVRELFRDLITESHFMVMSDSNQTNGNRYSDTYLGCSFDNVSLKIHIHNWVYFCNKLICGISKKHLNISQNILLRWCFTNLAINLALKFISGTFTPCFFSLDPEITV